MSEYEKPADPDGPVLPLVLLTENGNVSALAYMNEKSYRKSIERGYLWCVDEKTGRVLPYKTEISFTALTHGENWYSARIQDGEISSENRTASDITDPGSAIGSQPGNNTPGENAPGNASILAELTLLLKQRKVQLPEGSYASYLFRQGIDKIRKKTGEEAVELILARDKSEIVSEAADLIFHLLVLFEALDLDFSDVFRELRNRHR